MSYEPKDYKAISKYNRMIIDQIDKEELKQKLLSSAKIPPIIKEVLEEREVLLKWIEAIVMKNDGKVSIFVGPAGKGYNILSAWSNWKSSGRSDHGVG